MFKTLFLPLLIIASMYAASQPVPVNEYTYDENGNMKGDANKEIAFIRYNVLNLPDTITFKNGYKVSYTYSAAGHKLIETLLSPEATTVQRTDYARNFRFQNDTLQSIEHPEGRVTPTLPGNLASDWEYQYYMTDHLGNVRMTITSQTDTMQYLATMENEKGGDEENLFQGIDQHRSSSIAANHTPKGNHVARLPNNTEKGIAVSFAVKRGDVIYSRVYAYHEGPVGDKLQSEQKPLTAILSIAAGLVSGGSSIVSESQRAVFEAGSATGLMLGKSEDTNAPLAHLNFQLFDKSFKLIDAGFKAVSKDESFTSELLKIEPIVVRQTGYLHVYLSNTTEQNIPVYFDDLQITHIQSPVVQEDSYDPFGITLTEQHDQRLGKLPNQLLFNGKELLDSARLNWYDYGARMYDAALGRWHVPDLLTEKYPSVTSYQYVMNNPINLVDPDGHDVVFHQAGADKERYEKLMTAMTWLKGTDEGKKILSKAENNKNITVYVAGTHNIQKGKVGGLTTHLYKTGKLFEKEIKDKKTVQIGAIEGVSADDFSVFVGLDVTETVKKNKDVYFVLIDVDQFSNFGISNLTGHEIEAHVNISNNIKGAVKPNGKFDVEVDGKKMEMDHEDLEHLMFGSPGVRLNGGDPVIINQGTSAERLAEQLRKLWMDMARQVLPYGGLLM